MTDPLNCWNCASSLDDFPLPLGRHDQCEQCGEMLHSCRQCLHFDRGAVDQCREDQADPPTNKESGNFCEYFSPISPGPTSKQSGATEKLGALFGDKNSDNPASNNGSGNPLDDLFKD